MNPTSVVPRPIEIAVSRFEIRVRPGLFRAAPRYGEQPAFVIVNQAGMEATVDFLRDDLVLDQAGQNVKTFRLADGGTSAVLNVNMDLPDGRYEYSISFPFGTRGKLEASGGSRPEMEVRR